MTSTPTRPLRAFLLAPLVGVAVLWLLLVTLGIPRGVQDARQWSKPIAVPWVMMCAAAGASTGAAFG